VIATILWGGRLHAQGPLAISRAVDRGRIHLDGCTGQAGGKLPPGVAMENVSFYRKHQGEIQKLGEEQS
jgi:hypothetical protein